MSRDDHEIARLRMIADRSNLQSAADLDAFLETDPKTKDEPRVRALYRKLLQDAVPRLRDPKVDPSGPQPSQ